MHEFTFVQHQIIMRLGLQCVLVTRFHSDKKDQASSSTGCLLKVEKFWHCLSRDFLVNLINIRLITAQFTHRRILYFILFCFFVSPHVARAYDFDACCCLFFIPCNPPLGDKNRKVLFDSFSNAKRHAAFDSKLTRLLMKFNTFFAEALLSVRRLVRFC